MNELEKEAFIQCIEISIDYYDPISADDIKLYNQLIEERMKKNESAGIK